jgi:O-antigen/teichoic acid export membrane protein
VFSVAEKPGSSGARPPEAHYAVRGAALLIVRQGLVSILTLAGIVSLSLLLEPSEFALYGYVTTVMLVAAAVGDLGLGARLIRGPEPTARELQGSLALQLAFWAPVCLLAAAGGIAFAVYGFKPLTVSLLCLALFVLSLQALPTALLERRLAFGSIAVIEVLQRLVFVGGAVALAATAPGQAAIPIAAAAAAIVGYPTAMAISRWRWKPRFIRGEPLFRGFSSDWWQSRIANQLTYAAYPLLGGILFTSTQVGLLVWALAISSVPALISPMVARALLPTISKAKPEHQIDIFRRLFKGLLVICLPLVAALFALAEPLTLEVFGSKWEDGIPLLRLESVTTMLGLGLTTCVPLLFLTLPSQRVKRIMVASAVAAWTIPVALAPLASYRAISITQIAVNVVLLLIFSRMLDTARGYSLIRDMRTGLVSVGIAVAIGLSAAKLVDNIPELAIAGMGVMAAQALVAFALGDRVDPRTVFRLARKQPGIGAPTPPLTAPGDPPEFDDVSR